jgi:hypothetical protein
VLEIDEYALLRLVKRLQVSVSPRRKGAMGDSPPQHWAKANVHRTRSDDEPIREYQTQLGRILKELIEHGDFTIANSWH